MYYLGTRGREWIRFLKKNNIIIKTDSNGCEYIEILGLNAIQKNSQPTLKARHDDLKQSRIYSSQNSCSCPVQAIKLLLNKLPPQCENVFYKKAQNWKTQEFWYNPRLPLGVHTIGNMMKKISISAKLSKVYTSHCIRPTVVSQLFNAGVPTTDIQCVTGHKNQDSVKRYIKRIDDSKKQMLSKNLHKSFEMNSKFLMMTIYFLCEFICNHIYYSFIIIMIYRVMLKFQLDVIHYPPRRQKYRR